MSTTWAGAPMISRSTARYRATRAVDNSATVTVHRISGRPVRPGRRPRRPFQLRQPRLDGANARCEDTSSEETGSERTARVFTERRQLL